MFYKKVLSTVMALMLSVNISSTVNATDSATSGSCGDDVKWLFNESKGTLTISGTGNMTDFSDYLDVPWYSNKNSIKSVVIKNGVTSIGKAAFYNCTGLTSMNIPNSVTSIGDWAIALCTDLTSIDIPYGVMKIGWVAFYGCKNLTFVVIPGSVNYIKADAFTACFNLYSLNYTGISDIRCNNRTFASSVIRKINVPTNYKGNTFCKINVSKIIKLPSERFTSFCESVYEKILYLLKFCQFSIAFLM